MKPISYALHFVPFGESDGKQVTEWLRNDPVGKRFIDYQDGKRWYNLVQSSKNRWGFMVCDREEKIGFVDLEKIGDVGWIAFYICPQRRGQGLGSRLLKDLLAHLKDWPLQSVQAAVELENTVSIRTLKTSGFTKVGKDQDGLLLFSAPPG